MEQDGVEVVCNRNVIVEFNPWNFSDQDELVKDFFNSMVEKLKLDDEDKDGLLSKLKKYAPKFRKPDKAVFAPEINGTSIGSLEWNLEGESLKKQKDKIDEALKELGQRIIIVIDDIDRLDRDETKLIFKLVKLTADFPNTVFYTCLRPR